VLGYFLLPDEVQQHSVMIMIISPGGASSHMDTAPIVVSEPLNNLKPLFEGDERVCELTVHVQCSTAAVDKLCTDTPSRKKACSQEQAGMWARSHPLATGTLSL
jgi:hypothetical protein